MSNKPISPDEVEALKARLAEQERRIAALEEEARLFREVEAQFLHALSRANAEFRGILRAVRRTPGR